MSFLLPVPGVPCSDGCARYSTPPFLQVAMNPTNTVFDGACQHLTLSIVQRVW